MNETPRRFETSQEPEILDRLGRIEDRLGRLLEDDKVARLEPWLSKREAAKVLGVSPKWLQERVRFDGLPHRELAGAHKFRLSVIEPWLLERGFLKEVA